jgi:type I restriction enzyme R subunit
MPRPDSEDTLEHAAMDLFASLDWQIVTAFKEVPGPTSLLGREHAGEVVLRRELRAALHTLNPALPASALELAVEEITRDRSVLGMVQANHEIWQLLREGVVVAFSNDEGEQLSERVRVIGWGSGTPRAAARATRWSSSPRRSCVPCSATGHS